MKPSSQLDTRGHAADPALALEDAEVAAQLVAQPVAAGDPSPPAVAPLPSSLPDTASANTAEHPLWKTFLVFLAPMLLSNILQSLSGTLNNVYVGQMIGVGALAAVSSFFPVMFFFIAFTIGLGAGASVLIGQAWGARDTSKVKAVAGTTLTVGVAFGIVVAILGGTFTTPLLTALGTPPDILADATRYARIMLIAMPGMFVFLLATAPLATPSLGRPSQPRISAGVMIMPITVEIASV